MRISRRKLCSLLPLALVPGRSLAEGGALSSFAVKFEEMPVTKNKSGDAEYRRITKGKTVTGEQIEAHETVLQPGAAPHAPHVHDHGEFWLVREGTVELTIRGKKYQLGPGSAGFAAGKEEHGIRNVGKVPATYFVVAIGPTA
jgi:mannose-6-phosphate isomerase-like protein (cupin superfamily)